MLNKRLGYSASISLVALAILGLYVLWPDARHIHYSDSANEAQAFKHSAQPPEKSALYDSAPNQEDILQPVHDGDGSPDLLAAKLDKEQHASPVELPISDEKIYQVSNLDEYYSELAELAEAGDHVAARTLHEGLRNCKSAPRTLVNLSNRIDHVLLSPESYPEGGQSRIDNLKSRYQLCRGVTEKQLQTVGDWAAHLAEAGDNHARFRYLWDGRPTDSSNPDFTAQYKDYQMKALNFLHEAVAEGSPKGLAGMSMSYMQGMVTPRDPVMAYAYTYAAAHHPSSPSIAAQDLLETMAARMSEDELGVAVAEGAEILESCCNSSGSGR